MITCSAKISLLVQCYRHRSFLTWYPPSPLVWFTERRISHICCWWMAHMCFARKLVLVERFWKKTVSSDYVHNLASAHCPWSWLEIQHDALSLQRDTSWCKGESAVPIILLNHVTSVGEVGNFISLSFGWWFWAKVSGKRKTHGVGKAGVKEPWPSGVLYSQQTDGWEPSGPDS